MQRERMRDIVRMELVLNTYLRLEGYLSGFMHLDSGAILIEPEPCFAWRPGRWPRVTSGMLMNQVSCHRYF